MTTVYVNKRLGIALTDSRATEEVPRYFLGHFPLTPIPKKTVVNQKAIYIHDRLFLATGSVAIINRIAQYFVTGVVPYIPNKKQSCECLLVGDEYSIKVTVEKGKFKKKVLFTKNDFYCIMGSGTKILFDLLKIDGTETANDVIKQFRKVTRYDPYTDDNINLYRI